LTGENEEVCNRSRQLITGLGRSDYRSKPAKVADGQRKELAMRRIIGCG